MATTGGRVLITWLKKRATTEGKALSLQMLLCGTIAILVIGCGSSGQAIQARSSHSQDSQAGPKATVTPLTAVDWANFTYFSSCYGNTQAFHTRNGQATNGHVHFYVYPP